MKSTFLNPEPEGTINGYWMPTVVFGKNTGVTREILQQAFEAEKADLDNTIKEEQLKTNIDGLFKEQKVITENETMFDSNLHEKENLQSWFNLIQEHQNNFNLQELNDIFVKNKNLIQDNPTAMSFILESEFAIKQQENVSQRVNENQSQNLLIKC